LKLGLRPAIWPAVVKLAAVVATGGRLPPAAVVPPKAMPVLSERAS
jgi:hypothetical protein